MIGAEVTRNVRRAKPGDSKVLAKLAAESWRGAYRGLIPSAHLEGMIERRNATWWARAARTEGHLLVIEVGGEIAGYASCGATRDGSVYKGEIYELYLAPLYQGLGLGEHLFEACRNELDRRGLNGLMVWALEDNDIAMTFYWRRGGRPVTRRVERFGTTKLGKIAFGWH